MTQLFNKLNSCELAGGNSTINEYLTRPYQNDGLAYHMSERIQRTEEFSTDSYKITWMDTGLSVEDQRVLQKILKKDYADSGRKRGAILRYIKHFKQEPDPTGQRLYQTCQNQLSTQ
jgi:hypothetical protein